MSEEIEQQEETPIKEFFVVKSVARDGQFKTDLEELLNHEGGDATVVWLEDGFVHLRLSGNVFLRAGFDLGEFEMYEPCDCCGK